MISPETLRRFPLFAGLDAALFKDLAMIGEEHDIKQGEWLFHEGDDADTLYMVMHGAVDLKIKLDEKGTRLIDLSTLGDGRLVGWSALVEPYIYTLGAVALKDSHIIQLDAARMREMMARNPQMGYVIMGRLAQMIGQRLTDLRIQFASLMRA